uniref:Uncharacterized protein n=1 Tax=Moniliophthora roreri TaxID=221103 RepID=A0A0W0G756_MONRR
MVSVPGQLGVCGVIAKLHHMDTHYVKIRGSYSSKRTPQTDRNTTYAAPAPIAYYQDVGLSANQFVSSSLAGKVIF